MKIDIFDSSFNDINKDTIKYCHFDEIPKIFCRKFSCFGKLSGPLT
jgi:hypothetical protein